MRPYAYRLPVDLAPVTAVCPQTETATIRGSNLAPATSVHRVAVVLPAVAATYLVMGAWIVFGHGETDLVLAVVTLVLVMFAGLMLAGAAFAWNAAPEQSRTFGQFLKGRVETATGPFTGLEALVEIATLPAVLIVGGSAILIVAALAGF